MSTETVQTLGLEAALPSPNESCDKCSAAATVGVELTIGRLVFCKHHFKEVAKAEAFSSKVLSVAFSTDS